MNDHSQELHRDSHSDSYRAAGVDVQAGYRAVELMQAQVARTLTPGAVGGLGGFGGLFRPDLSHIKRPILVSGTDGVGTKLRLAFLLDQHDSVGIDCVAMCVNDVICAGATPLFFLDYIACGKNQPQRIADIVAGVAEGCVQAGCALIGGETAEMPGFYPPDEYDLAGFCVGLADEDRLVEHSQMRPGDAIIALPSSGLHSNGFSLVRQVFDVEKNDLRQYVAELAMPLGQALLTPTAIYVKPVLALLQQLAVSGLAHITGGGFYENIPRMLGPGCAARIEQQAVRTPPIFELLQKRGHIPTRDMFNTFNMGVGMTAVVAADQADAALRLLQEQGLAAYFLGEIVDGKQAAAAVELC